MNCLFAVYSVCYDRFSMMHTHTHTRVSIIMFAEVAFCSSFFLFLLPYSNTCRHTEANDSVTGYVHRICTLKSDVKFEAFLFSYGGMHKHNEWINILSAPAKRGDTAVAKLTHMLILLHASISP
jgi:hypothetical protein